ncbi:MAG TPA: TonB family protein [Candidatus Acidoferrales bacterium]|nr:TonB family protein [Candidatus Acidoferrales bacterium]
MNSPLWFVDVLFWSLQVAVLAVAAALLVKILRIHEPRALLVCWRMLIGASLLLPFVEPWKRQEAFAFAPAGPDISIVPTTAVASPTVSHWQIPSLVTIAEILAAVMAAGIAVRFVMLALGLMKMRQLRRKSATIARDAECAGVIEETRALVGGGAEFRVSGEVESPVTFGFAKPVVLLPERFLQLDERFQAAIACHELLHVRRLDWAHHLGEEVLRAIFWFHPAILWFVARVRLAREQVVDLEVVKLTAARKTYVEALLEFTSGRRVAAIPAPPFLAEQQFVERVALMLKEAGMSRRRLIASLSAIACGLVAATVLAVTVFPLKAAPRAAAGVQETQAASEPVLNASKVWTDKVKQGTMDVDVRGLGTMTPLNGQPVAKMELRESESGDVRAGQSAEVDTHKGIVKGHVLQISPQVIEGNRSVLVALDSAVPSGVDAHASVEGTIQVGELKDVVYVGRPYRTNMSVTPEGRVVGVIYKIVDNGKEAERLHVVFGRVSVSTIQVLSGLKPGDAIILSDMSTYRKFDRVEIKQASAASDPSLSLVSASDTPLAGKGGYGSPTCRYCPDPQYSDDAYRQKIQGKIVLDTVVGTDGRAHDTRVVQGLGHGLDEQAIHSLRDVWRFKPAKGPDGKPAAVRTLIDVDFHLY